MYIYSLDHSLHITCFILIVIIQLYILFIVSRAQYNTYSIELMMTYCSTYHLQYFTRSYLDIISRPTLYNVVSVKDKKLLIVERKSVNVLYLLKFVVIFFSVFAIVG